MCRIKALHPTIGPECTRWALLLECGKTLYIERAHGERRLREYPCCEAEAEVEPEEQVYFTF